MCLPYEKERVLIISTCFFIHATFSRTRMLTILSTPPANGLKIVRLELWQKGDIANFLITCRGCKHFNLPRTIVSTIAKAEFSKNRNSTAKAFNKSPFDVIDEPLARWVKTMFPSVAIWYKRKLSICGWKRNKRFFCVWWLVVTFQSRTLPLSKKHFWRGRRREHGIGRAIKRHFHLSWRDT